MADQITQNASPEHEKTPVLSHFEQTGVWDVLSRTREGIGQQVALAQEAKDIVSGIGGRTSWIIANPFAPRGLSETGTLVWSEYVERIKKVRAGFALEQAEQERVRRMRSVAANDENAFSQKAA